MFTEASLKVVFVLLLLSPLLIFSTRWGILLAKRFLLPRRLSRFAEKHGFSVTWHRPYLDSLFHRDGGFDFTLTAREKTYRVTILSARHRFREHSFVSSTGMDIYREIRFRRPATYSRRNLRRENVTVGISVSTVPIHLEEKAKEGEMKILLFYPVAKNVTKQVRGKKTILDNGSLLFSDTYLFTLSAFFKQTSGEQSYIRNTQKWEWE